MSEADLFAVLASPVRRDILVTLRGGPLPARHLASRFALGRPAVSEHLAVLRAAGLVVSEARGRERVYHLDPRPLDQVQTWIAAFSQYWNDRIDALDALLKEEA